MHDEVGLGDQLIDDALVGDRADGQAEAIGCLQVAHVLAGASGEVVERVHRMPFLQQQVAQMRADEARAPRYEHSHLAGRDHADDEGRRLCLSTVPPKPASTRIATPPPTRASSEPLPPCCSCSRAARSAASASAGAEPEPACGPEPACEPVAPLEEAPLGELDGAFREPARGGEPGELGGLMPAPNSVLSGLAWEPVSALAWRSEPVWRAWLSGSAYSFAAGEPGSAWTPGSRPLAA